MTLARPDPGPAPPRRVRCDRGHADAIWSPDQDRATVSPLSTTRTTTTGHDPTGRRVLPAGSGFRQTPAGRSGGPTSPPQDRPGEGRSTSGTEPGLGVKPTSRPRTADRPGAFQPEPDS